MVCHVVLGMLVVPEEGMSSLRDPSAGLLSSTFLVAHLRNALLPHFNSFQQHEVLSVNTNAPWVQRASEAESLARQQQSLQAYATHRARDEPFQTRVDGTKQDLDRQHRVKP